MLYVFVIMLVLSDVRLEDVPACDSEIYCHGDLLKTVQNAELFKDSKTFVDMNLKYPPDVVLRNFQTLMASGAPSKEDVQLFVNKTFDGPGNEFETWDPSDYVENPKFLDSVSDANLKSFGKSMCGLWKVLGRKIIDDVKMNSSRYSLLYVPHPFIVPGGRFREAYYWDSYWVVKGLLTCEMTESVKNMLQNFFYIVDEIGFVPNGFRVYYTRRSQPPFLTGMVESYYRSTGNKTFLTESLPFLEKEYSFWMTNRAVTINKGGKDHVLNKYGTLINRPRPESYREDIKTASHLANEEDKSMLYQNLASAAESGWDFSSRWFNRDQENELTLSSTVITDIVPVDLNSIMCMNERLLAEFYQITGNIVKSDEYKMKFESRKAALMAVMWSRYRGVWQDYLITDDSLRDYFYPSNILPLFAQCVGDSVYNKTWYEDQVLKYLKSHIGLNFAGGVPTSLLQSGQQWDYPNVWPPLQHMVVDTLARGTLKESRDIARDLAQKYMLSNWKAWDKNGHMFEKFDVNVVGGRGGGGEYDIQTGFGWSNGVVLDFLSRYGSSLTTEMTPVMPTTAPPTCGASCLYLPYLIMIGALITIFIQSRERIY